MTIQISDFAQKHLSPVARLLNEEYGSSYEFIPFDEKRVLSEIRRRNVRVLVAEEDGIVLGLVGTHKDERGEDIHWLATSGGHDRKAVEDTLVNIVEKNAEGDTISTMIDEESPRIKDWTSRGYILQPGFQRMSARLDGLKHIPEVAEEIKLKSLGHGEEAKLVQVINAGFGWGRLEFGDLEEWKVEDPPFNEEWVQVAEVGERIVSAVVAKPDTNYMKYLHVKRGYLGPAATLPEFRGKHLASALTARAMNFLFQRGMNSVRLGTSEQNVSSIALLRSLGFQVDGVRKLVCKKLKTA